MAPYAPFGGFSLSRAAIKTWLALLLSVPACGTERIDLRRAEDPASKGPTGRDLDASAQKPLIWNLTCDDVRAELDDDSATVNGRGGLQVPEDFSGRLAVRFQGPNCAKPAAKRGRDIVLAFELSDSMAALDPVAQDGTCARSRLLRDWAANEDALDLDESDGEVRFSLVLYSRVVLAKVAGFYPKLETVVQRLLSTQKKADLDSLLCLGRGAAELDLLANQVETMKSNFGRSEAASEIVFVGYTGSESASLPPALSGLKEKAWHVGGVIFGAEQEALPSWTTELSDQLGTSLWSATDEADLQSSVQKLIKNRIEWRFAHRLMTRPAAEWSVSDLIQNESASGWQMDPIGLVDDGSSWGIEAQLRAIDRFGVSNSVLGAYLQW
jgi:hypothetical protein